MECNEGPSDLTDSSTCPVLQWNGYTYWPMTYDDNRFSFARAHELGNQAARWGLPGSRYVVDMTVDTTAGTLTIFGQLNFGVDSVVVNLADIYLRGTGSVDQNAGQRHRTQRDPARPVRLSATRHRQRLAMSARLPAHRPRAGAPIRATTVRAAASNTALTASFSVTSERHAAAEHHTAR